VQGLHNSFICKWYDNRQTLYTLVEFLQTQGSFFFFKYPDTINFPSFRMPNIAVHFKYRLMYYVARNFTRFSVLQYHVGYILHSFDKSRSDFILTNSLFMRDFVSSCLTVFNYGLQNSSPPPSRCCVYCNEIDISVVPSNVTGRMGSLLIC
jgi:hypothetical protein